jgi:hypothetical protein
MVPTQQKGKDGSSMEVNKLLSRLSDWKASHIVHHFSCFIWLNIIFDGIDYDNTATNRSSHEYPCLEKAWYNAYCKITNP